ncbi:MAG TPA: hypothetical protein VH498_07240, partial [Candidatus Dormibacteraeota bacterium]|nr:hypothetical protein [Candidatus Dormibacteraeota bacterium]
MSPASTIAEQRTLPISSAHARWGGDVGVIAWAGLVVGVLLVALTWASVLETTVVPRSRRTGLSALIFRLSGYPVTVATSRVDDFEARDRIHAYASAGYLIATLVVWLLLFLIG